MRHIYTSIDFGSDSIKVVVCELYQSKLNLLAASSSHSKGIKSGLIVDPNQAEESIRAALNEIESMLGIRVRTVIATVPSHHASFNVIHGKTMVNGLVTKENISAALESAYKTKENNDKEMVSIMPIDFDTDTESGLKDPKGHETGVLSARAMMVSVPKKNIYSVVGLLEKMGLEVIDIMVGSVGDINTFKTKENSKKVGAIINVGADITSVSLYNKGIPIKNTILGMGSRNIDQDIAYIYKLQMKDAIKIKESFAHVSKKYASSSDFYEVVDKFGEAKRISQREVSEICETILEEILVSARKEINLLTKQTVDYIILTGGTSSMASFGLFTEELLGSSASVGKIKIPGVRSGKYSTALGNIVYFINKLKLKGIDYSMFEEEELLSLSKEQKGFVSISSESMLGKVFGYFFSE